jgi:ribonuclease VapC
LILDSSAIVAVLLKEPSYERLVELLAENPEPGVGAPTMVETGIVLSVRLGERGQTLLSRFSQAYELAILPCDAEHWTIAVQAFLRFGKGRHAASLNFGDCLTYATARLADEPLLCLGEDFAKTDLTLVG